MEIRAVRLYTKRGSKGFSEGVVGTMKVLRHKETQKQRLRTYSLPLSLKMTAHSFTNGQFFAVTRCSRSR